jgi:hypothetical protein
MANAELSVRNEANCKVAASDRLLPVTATDPRLPNGCFYEGVCQAPLEFRCSVLQWIVSFLSLVVVMSLSMIRLQLLACR